MIKQSEQQNLPGVGAETETRLGTAAFLNIWKFVDHSPAFTILQPGPNSVVEGLTSVWPVTF